MAQIKGVMPNPKNCTFARHPETGEQVLHSYDDKPAVSELGYAAWYHYGKRRRFGGAPAIVARSSMACITHYYLHGVKHRIDGPAVSGPNGDYWYRYGLLHNLRGPARPGEEGEYWVDGVQYPTKRSYEKACEEFIALEESEDLDDEDEDLDDEDLDDEDEDLDEDDEDLDEDDEDLDDEDDDDTTPATGSSPRSSVRKVPAVTRPKRPAVKKTAKKVAAIKVVRQKAATKPPPAPAYDPHNPEF